MAIMTTHIRRMLQVSSALSYWAQHGEWRDQDYDLQDIKERAIIEGPDMSLLYAAALARHAAAEMEMEVFQTRGWPAV